MGTWLVLSSLIIVCGIIAYTGDLLGRRLGKRRLTIFGLRPRHTAVLCTVVTGMVIAGVTLAAMVGLSAGVRRAVLQGEALLIQNSEYRTQRDDLQRETTRLTAEVEPLRRQNADLVQSNQAMETQNRSLADQNCSLIQSEKSLMREKGALQRTNQRAHQDLRSTRRQREIVVGELKGVREQLRVASASLEVSRQRVQEIHKELAQLQAREQYLRIQADMLTLGDVRVREGEELARLTVPANSSPSETLARVQMLMTRVRQIARDRGAQRKGSHLEAYLQNSRLAHMFGTADPVDVAEGRLVQMLVRLVADSDDDVVLRAQAVQNTAKSEPVPFDINPYWNVLAFRKGEEIASTTIDPGLSQGRILEQLAGLLRTRVRNVSFDRQMIPGPRNELGEVRYDPLLEVANKVKRLGVPAKVGVVAAREVRSADPLEVDFYVVPVDAALASRAAQVRDGEQ